MVVSEDFVVLPKSKTLVLLISLAETIGINKARNVFGSSKVTTNIRFGIMHQGPRRPHAEIT